MSVNFSGADSGDVDPLYQIMQDLKAQQQNKDNSTVDAFLEERVKSLIKANILAPNSAEIFKAAFVKFKGKKIQSLSQKDLTSLQHLLQDSLKDSGFYEKPPLALFIKEALLRLEHPHPKYSVKDVVLELQDPEIKTTFILFLQENEIDPTELLSDLPPQQKKLLADFLKKTLKENPDTSFTSKKEAESYLKSRGVDVKGLIDRFVEKSEFLKDSLNKLRHKICVEGMSGFDSSFLSIAETEADFFKTLTTIDSIEGFPICKQVQKDFLQEKPRTSYLNIKFPGAPGQYIKTQEDVLKLFQRIQFFSESAGGSKEEIEFNNKIVSFFCTQHTPNAFLIFFRQPLMSRLIELECDDYETQLTSAHMEFIPTKSKEGSLSFEVQFSAVLEIAPVLSFKYASAEEKETLLQAFKLVGLGPCSSFNITGSFEVEGNKSNPVVTPLSYRIS